MAVIDLTPTNGGSDGVPAAFTGKMAVLKKTLDCAVTNVGAGDVVKLFKIPANVRILNVTVNVLTVEGASEVVDVGDYTTATDAAVDADGFIANASINAVAAVQSQGSSSNYQHGLVYTATGKYLGAYFAAAANAAKIQFIVELINLN